MPSRSLSRHSGKQKIRKLSSLPILIVVTLICAFFLGILYVVFGEKSIGLVTDEPDTVFMNRLNVRLTRLEDDVRKTLYEIQEFSLGKIEDINSKILNKSVEKPDKKKVSWLSMFFDNVGATESSSTLVSHSSSKSTTSSPKDFFEIIKLSKVGVEEKGRYIFYKNNYGDIDTNGSYYKYIHNYNDNCEIEKISLKFLPDCPESLRILRKQPETDDQVLKNLTFIRPLLVVAVQRSGTHYVWEMLNRLGIDVHHEGVGPDGAISWLFAYKLDMFPDPNKPAVIKPGRTKPPPNKYVINNKERLTYHRFRYVFHQVRHPLRVISTLLARCGKWDRIWLWLSYMDGLEEIDQHQSPLKRSMLLWYLWNRHIERFADLRFRSEDTSPRDVCSWSGFDPSICARANGISGPVVEPVASAISGGSDGSELIDRQDKSTQSIPPPTTPIEDLSIQAKHKSNDATSSSSNSSGSSSNEDIVRLQWRDLERADASLARKIKVMCLEYGYSLDPYTHRQHSSTREFKA